MNKLLRCFQTTTKNILVRVIYRFFCPFPFANSSCFIIRFPVCGPPKFQQIRYDSQEDVGNPGAGQVKLP
jgi:hypothetical protein